MNALFIGATGGMLAVALSAFGAHALQSTFSERAIEVYQTAADYQFYHSLALAFVSLLGKFYPDTKKLNWSAGFFTAGMLLFCGSLYLLSFTGIRWFGMITPLGGVSFILGWLFLIFFALFEYSE